MSSKTLPIGRGLGQVRVGAVVGDEKAKDILPVRPDRISVWFGVIHEMLVRIDAQSGIAKIAQSHASKTERVRLHRHQVPVVQPELRMDGKVGHLQSFVQSSKEFLGGRVHFLKGLAAGMNSD